MTHLLRALLLIVLTAVTFFLISALGYVLMTSAVILILTTSYAIKYRISGAGVGFAYFGLAYIGFGLMLLGIGLVQTHAGCMFLLGDCYQPTLPPWMFEIKAGANLYLTIVNALALTSAYLNTREISRLLNEKSRI
ncbi:hypothetical protein OAN31_01100 [Pseudomonadales bacterium]|jgi:hypothetical protein|nr:hypothetical protein [Pseudomonadales bacterium]